MKKVLLFLVSMVLVFQPLNAAVFNGTCGSGGAPLTWSLDTSTGLLVISGTGAMVDYANGAAPWYSYREQITACRVDAGCTHMASSAFYGCTKIAKVSYPLSLDDTFPDFECTPSGFPGVQTEDATSIDKTTATIKGLLTSDGGLSITEYKLCWGTSPSLTSPTCQTVSSTFTYNLTGLTEGTTYYYQASATNANGSGSGTIKSFTTLVTPTYAPTVQTADASSVDKTTATISGLVTNDGGLSITEYKLCWGTSPTLTSPTCQTVSSTFTYNLTGLAEGTTYYYQATATNSKGSGEGTIKSFTTKETVAASGTECGHDWVQLWDGGPKWATMNVGASSPEDAGDYYAYAETTTRSSYTQTNYPYGNTTMSKYNATDHLVTMEASDDPATVNWCGSWRTPTKDEWQALVTNCNVVYSQAKKGITVTSKEDPSRSIFIPNAGYFHESSIQQKDLRGKYLTATVQTSGSYAYIYAFEFMWYVENAYSTNFASGGKPSTSEIYRCYGHTVRAVCD